MQVKPPTPTRLKWSFDDELLKTIDNAYNDALKLAAVSQSNRHFLNFIVERL